MKQLLLFCLLLFAVVTASAQTNKRIRQLQQQSTELQEQIKASESLLKSTKKDVASQLNNLAVINSQIADQQKLVDGFQAEVTALATEISRMQRELKVLEADLSSCKHKYRRAVLYLNRNRLLQNRWTFVLMSKSFRQMYRRMRYAANYSKYLRAQGEVIKEKEKTLRLKQQKLQEAKRGKETLLAAARNQHVILAGQKTKRQGVINELNKKQSQLKRTIKQQRRKQADLDSRIDQLIKQEIAAAEARRKKEAAARKAAEARKKKEREARERTGTRRNKSGKKSSSSRSGADSDSRTATPRFEEEDVADRTLSTGFSSNKGRLPVPITGAYAVTSRYGQYNVAGLSGVTLDNKGVNLTGRRGAKARSVYDGEVSVIASIGGLYTVIVRHGGYFSVYSNLSNVSVRKGQKVKTRQVLGAVSTDASGNCTLHFQLRKQSGRTADHINPLPWLAR